MSKKGCNIGIDLVGSKYNRFTVLSCIVPSEGKKNYVGNWLCKCDCGKVMEVTGRTLIFGIAKSCGCLQKEAVTKTSLSRRASDRVTYTSRYASHKMSAIKRGYTPLPKDIWHVIVTQPCHYCGEIDMRNNFLAANHSYQKKRNIKYTQGEIDEYKVPCNGVDRINSDIGYALENSVPCCTQCNYMKCEYSQEDFFNKIQLIYNKHFSNIEYSNIPLESFLID